ncbi:MAG: aminotransferase class IV [Acidobacteriota bacterium]
MPRQNPHATFAALMVEVVWINGRLYPRHQARISAFDHGFLYGDSVYETIRTSHGHPFLLERHLERLSQSAVLLDLPLDRQPADYRQAVETAIAAGGNKESALRIVVTRGVGDIGYDRALCASPTTLIYVKPLLPIRNPILRRGIAVVIVDIRRNDGRAVSPTIKSGNLLNNLLASHEAQKKGVQEGIMLNGSGELAEGTMTNLFVVRRGRLMTPPLEAGILPGITRAFVMDLARKVGIKTHETPLRPPDLMASDEAFLTGTTRGILPIISVDQTPVGLGVSGPVTRRLIDLFDAEEDAMAAAL